MIQIQGLAALPGADVHSTMSAKLG